MVGTFSNRNPLMPEVNTATSLPYFSWFYPGNFLASPRTGSHSSQGSQIIQEPALAAEAIESVAPTAKQPKNEAKKQKLTTNDANTSKVLKPKQTKKNPAKKPKDKSMPEAKREKRNLNLDVHKTNFDFSGVPSPYCSCTRIPRVCYKWGAGGWQSSCCTIKLSEYPLPMSSSRPGSRIAGRKMSNGAYGKLLLGLAAEGYDLANPVDLKDHWARHGTNKFVTIK